MTTRLAAPFFAVATTVGLLTLSACGGGSSTPASVPADADVVVKAEEGIQWNAKSFTATATDGKVTLFAENDSALAHNVYVLDSNDKVQGTFIDLPTKGSSGTRELSLAPGTYRIVCKVPGHNNMNSELVVS
jgi:plastocyanin